MEVLISMVTLILMGIMGLVGLIYLEFKKFSEYLCKPIVQPIPMMSYPPPPLTNHTSQSSGDDEPVGFRPQSPPTKE